MLDRKNYNNSVLITGKVHSEFVFNHEVFGLKFYEVIIAVKRLSEAIDFIPVMISEELIDASKIMIGSEVRVRGVYRSYNKQVDNKNKLLLFVLAKKLDVLEKDDNSIEINSNINKIYLQGYVCKKPVYRQTPLGKEITELLLAVDFSYGRTNYIPCICWGIIARNAANYEIGTKIEIRGRIQSREYHKILPSGEVDPETKTAYEVSCMYAHKKNHE